MSSRKIGREVLELLGGPPGVFAVHLDELGGERVVVVEVAPSRITRHDNLPKWYKGLRIVYKPQAIGRALAV